MIYVETLGHRWATQAVSFKSAKQAIGHAMRCSFESIQVRVFDCSKSPVGVLLATYQRGRRIKAARP